MQSVFLEVIRYIKKIERNLSNSAVVVAKG